MPSDERKSEDEELLRAAVRKGLLSKPEAKDVFKKARASQQSASQVLMSDGLMAERTIQGLQADISKGAPPQKLGGCRIIKLLGKGGMGAVYLAEQERLSRQVALKVLPKELADDPAFEERFLREAKSGAQVNHPNVVTIHDAGRDAGRLYMALELIKGGDVEELCRENGGKLPEQRAVAIIADATRGLQAIHEAGLLHRDIKPANILLTAKDAAGCQAKLADLGLARQSSGEDRQTLTGQTLGTPAFMSPEQAHGVNDLDIRSDIYSLGATLYALCCGQPPFTGSTAWAVVAQVINETPPDPRSLCPALSPQVCTLIETMMAKDRDDRPHDPQQLLALINSAQGNPALATAPTLINQPTLANANKADKAASASVRSSNSNAKIILLTGLGVLAVMIVVVAVVMMKPAVKDTLRSSEQTNTEADTPTSSGPTTNQTASSAPSVSTNNPPNPVLPAAAGERYFRVGIRNLAQLQQHWQGSRLQRVYASDSAGIARDTIATELANFLQVLQLDADEAWSQLQSAALDGVTKTPQDELISLYLLPKADQQNWLSRVQSQTPHGMRWTLQNNWLVMHPEHVLPGETGAEMVTSTDTADALIELKPALRVKSNQIGPQLVAHLAELRARWTLTPTGTQEELTFPLREFDADALRGIPSDALAAGAIAIDGPRLWQTLQLAARHAKVQIPTQLALDDLGLSNSQKTISDGSGSYWFAFTPGPVWPHLSVSLPRNASTDAIVKTLIQSVKGDDQAALAGTAIPLPLDPTLTALAQLQLQGSRWVWSSDPGRLRSIAQGDGTFMWKNLGKMGRKRPGLFAYANMPDIANFARIRLQMLKVDEQALHEIDEFKNLWPIMTLRGMGQKKGLIIQSENFSLAMSMTILALQTLERHKQ